MKLRTHLTALALGAIVPLVAVVIIAGAVLLHHERASIQRDAIGRTRAAMSAVDAEIRGVISSMDALAASSHLRTGDLRAFHEEARRFMASQPYWLNVILITSARMQVVDAVLPFGLPVPAPADGSLDAVIQTGRLAIGNGGVGQGGGAWAVWIRLPIVQEGAVRFVLSVPVKLELYDEVLQAQQIPADWVISVVDRNRRFIARIPPQPRGGPISESFRDALVRAPEGFFRGRTIEGSETYTPYVTSRVSGWVLGIAVPAEIIDASLLRLGAILTGGLAIALAVAWGLAWLMARRIARPIGALVAAAESAPPGEILAPSEAGRIDEIAQLHRVLQRAGHNVRERQELLETRDAALRAAVGEFETMFYTAPIGVAIARDQGCRHIEVNRELSRIFGTPCEDDGPRVIDPVQPQPYRICEGGRELPLDQRPMQLAAREGIVSTARELDVVRADGQTLKVLVYAVPITDASGRPRGAFGAFVDITERRRAEAERDALLAREQEARAAAEEAGRTKDAFLAMLGHELRNPLAAIVNALSVLDLTGAPPASGDRARKVIGRQAQHLSRLVDDLLDVSRVTTGKIRLNRRVLDLGDLVRSTMATWRAEGRFSAHVVSVETSSAWIMADETRVEQILSNVVGNALKYTEPGGRIAVRVRREDAQAVLEVDDTGAGIPAELIDSVFDLFVQGEAALDRARGGLGIGLTLVKALATLHGGSVSVRSEGAGRGSTFTIRLPHALTPPGPESATADAGSPPARSRRVLVIEDNDDAREMLRIVLVHAGHMVYEAADGPAGVMIATDARPDVALVDVGLPGLDGYEVARRIRAGSNGSMRLVAITGYGQADDRKRALEAGFDAHLTKPVAPDDLIAVVADAPAS
jgi:PAS domain S-box-containing protein